MSTGMFFTRSPRLAFLRKMVQENASHNYDSVDLKQVFKVLDRYCADNLPPENRGAWFAPLVMGGTPVNHTPPHLIFAAGAIYADLSWGEVEAVPFLSSPLQRNTATAVRFGPSDQFLLLDRDRNSGPLTDVLLLIPSKVKDVWVADKYGIPVPDERVTTVGYHAASESLFTAVDGGLLLMHEAAGKVLNPMATITEEEEILFFEDPIDQSKIERSRERLVEYLGTPEDVLVHNHECIKRVLEAYLQRLRR